MIKLLLVAGLILLVIALYRSTRRPRIGGRYDAAADGAAIVYAPSDSSDIFASRDSWNDSGSSDSFSGEGGDFGGGGADGDWSDSSDSSSDSGDSGGSDGGSSD